MLHVTDLSFEWVIDLLPKMNVGAYSVEAADVRHELDWQLWEKFKLPDGKSYYPGVIAHKTTTVEPPAAVGTPALGDEPRRSEAGPLQRYGYPAATILALLLLWRPSRRATSR